MAYFIHDYRRDGARTNIPPIQVRLGPDCTRYAYRRVSNQRYDVYACAPDACPVDQDVYSPTPSVELRRIGTVAGYYDGRQVWYVEMPPCVCGDDHNYDTRTAATYALLLAERKSEEE